MAVQRQDGWATDAKESGEDLTGKEFLFAHRGTDGKYYLATTDDKIAGVISEGRAVGYHTSINTGGQLKVIAESGITAGDRVQAGANGKAKTGSTSSFGEAMNSAATGEYVTIDCDRI